MLIVLNVECSHFFIFIFLLASASCFFFSMSACEYFFWLFDSWLPFSSLWPREWPWTSMWPCTWVWNCSCLPVLRFNVCCFWLAHCCVANTENYKHIIHSHFIFYTTTLNRKVMFLKQMDITRKSDEILEQVHVMEICYT